MNSIKTKTCFNKRRVLKRADVSQQIRSSSFDNVHYFQFVLKAGHADFSRFNRHGQNVAEDKLLSITRLTGGVEHFRAQVLDGRHFHKLFVPLVSLQLFRELPVELEERFFAFFKREFPALRSANHRTV